MTCPYCGHAVADTATVCPNCGGPLTPVVLPEPETARIAGAEPPAALVDSPTGPHSVLPVEAGPGPGPGSAPPDEPAPVHRPPPPSAWSALPSDAAPSPGPAPGQGGVPPATPNRAPLIVGGLILAAVALVCVLAGAVAALLAVFTTTRTGFMPTPTEVALVFPTIAAPTPGIGDGTPPRMPLETFKALYDDPAQRPLIIDVRSAETYADGHIAGAISFPESDVDARIAELPKDKLIIAYCQWPAENESARVAQKLHDQYGFSYDHLKVLLGGWNAWKAAGYPTHTGREPWRGVGGW